MLMIEVTRLVICGLLGYLLGTYLLSTDMFGRKYLPRYFAVIILGGFVISTVVTLVFKGLGL